MQKRGNYFAQSVALLSSGYLTFVPFGLFGIGSIHRNMLRYCFHYRQNSRNLLDSQILNHVAGKMFEVSGKACINSYSLGLFKDFPWAIPFKTFPMRILWASSFFSPLVESVFPCNFTPFIIQFVANVICTEVYSSNWCNKCLLSDLQPPLEVLPCCRFQPSLQSQWSFETPLSFESFLFLSFTFIRILRTFWALRLWTIGQPVKGELRNFFKIFIIYQFLPYYYC